MPCVALSVSVDGVPDKGQIGWTRLESIRMRESELRGKTLSLRLITSKSSRKRPRDVDGTYETSSDGEY